MPRQTKRNQVVQWRVFACPVCNTRCKAPKRNTNHKTGKGHRKMMWCYKCQKPTCHIQISR